MIITRLEEFDKSKVSIYMDDEYSFWLYQKELEQYKLNIGAEIPEALYQELMHEVVGNRAKQKALSVLKFMDRTEQELRTRLAEAGYPEEIINQTIAYVNNYNYLDDARLAFSYTRARMNKKSKLVIKTELMQKGVGSQIIAQVFEEVYSGDPQEDPELEAIRKAIARKTKAPEQLDFKEKQKLIASLYRKGFTMDKIRRLLE